MKRMILSTSGVNRYGYRVLTSGIRLDFFLANPVMYYNHDTDKFPIGTWQDIKVEGGKLTAIPFFDEVTEQSREAKALYEAGTLRACSIGFRIISSSEDPKLALAGQRYETVTECDLMEASLVGIPANPEATVVNLGFENNVFLTQQYSLSFIKTPFNMSKIAIALGLASDATEQQMEDAVKALNAANAEAVLSLGKSKGLVTDANEASYRSLATQNPQTLRAIFETSETLTAAPPAPANTSTTPAAAGTITAALRANTIPPTPKDERDAWSYLDWKENDPNGLVILAGTAKYNKLVADFEKS